MNVDDEKLRFLPRDLNAKSGTLGQSLFCDVVREYYTAKQIQTMINEDAMEIVLYFYAERTFKNTYVIADECKMQHPIG